jgi:hypothetical protein
MRQTIITHLILIFMLTTVFLCIVFSFYYITPHNYTLYEFNNKKTKKISSKELTINSKDQLVLAYTDYDKKLLKITRPNQINAEENKGICTIITNSFKSENIIIEPNNLIKLNYSDLIIKNNSTNSMKITIEIYSLV